MDLWFRSFLQTTRFRHFCLTSVLVCTSTLAWVVNLPGHHLVIIEMFNPAYYGLDNTESEFDIKWIRTA